MRLLPSVPASDFPGVLFLIKILRVIFCSSVEWCLPVVLYCFKDDLLHMSLVKVRLKFWRRNYVLNFSSHCI